MIFQLVKVEVDERNRRTPIPFADCEPAIRRSSRQCAIRDNKDDGASGAKLMLQKRTRKLRD